MIADVRVIDSAQGEHAENVLARVAFWFYVAVLTWAPFPLGSNRPWSWCLLTMLIAACWILWGFGTWSFTEQNWAPLRRFSVAFLLGVSALCWGVVQISPWVPVAWAHPVWTLASAALGHSVVATISLNPWRTATECLKLSTYIMALWLVYLMTRRTERAVKLLDAVIAIGAFYGLYATMMKIAGFVQFEVFYPTKPVADAYLSGPFVLHNSYATFAGLCALAATARLVTFSMAHIVTGRGIRQWLLSCLRLLFGRGVGILISFVVCFSTLIASASRAGFLSTTCAMLVMLIAASLVRSSGATRRWSVAAIGAFLILTVGLIALSGDTLAARLNILLDPRGTEDVRLALWGAALRMIGDAPLLGQGLGAFQDAYPLYASDVLPYVMDKAHNDYLEFAAGLGLPAAFAWWTGWLLLVVACLGGVFDRRRNRHFSILAVAASVLVAIHSAFDFSLQIPAVALVYTSLLGLGLAQSHSPQINT